MNMSYENNGAPLGSFVDLTHAQSLFVAPVVKWKSDDATWVKLEAEYNNSRQNTSFVFDPVVNGAFVNVPRSTNFGASSPLSADESLRRAHLVASIRQGLVDQAADRLQLYRF